MNYFPQNYFIPSPFQNTNYHIQKRCFPQGTFFVGKSVRISHVSFYSPFLHVLHIIWVQALERTHIFTSSLHIYHITFGYTVVMQEESCRYEFFPSENFSYFSFLLNK